MRLGQFSSRGVVTVRDDAPAWEAAETMHGRAVGCLVVVDAAGQALGILTDRDLTLRVVAAGGSVGDLSVGALMSSPLHALSPEDDLERAVRLMRAAGVRRLPLLVDGAPIGLVSLGDLLEVLARDLLDLGEESLAAREQALREARAKGPLGEIQELAHQAHERLGRAKYLAQEAVMDELDSIRDGLRKALERL